MEKEIKVGKTILKVYDFIVLALIFFITLSIAILNGAAQLNLPPYLISFIVIGSEMAYIFGVIKKRK